MNLSTTEINPASIATQAFQEPQSQYPSQFGLHDQERGGIESVSRRSFGEFAQTDGRSPSQVHEFVNVNPFRVLIVHLRWPLPSSHQLTSVVLIDIDEVAFLLLLLLLFFEFEKNQYLKKN